MTKKSLNKLLSVVLTLVICFTTVFGCLITANAASETCYTWSDGTVDKDTLKTATIDLTLTAPSELSDGINLAMFNLSYGSELALDSVNVVRGTRVNGTFSAEDYAVIYEKGGYLIEVNASPVDENVSSLDVNVTSITLELTFTFTAGLATQGEKYSVDVAANSLMMSSGTQGSDYYYTSTGTAGVINAGCDHVFDITGATLIETNTVDGYYVYKDVSCQKCGEINPYQVVPATELKNVLYLDGTTVTEPKTTDADGNILITSAAELAWVVSRNVTGNYKVADGIDAIVLQKPSDADKNGIDDVMELADYAQTKAYFESITPIGWSSSNGTFQGTFDGNGVEIYGMYLKDTYRAGLFGQVYENTTIKNIAVKNSYLDATKYAGAMVGYLAATTEYSDPINALSTWPEKDNASTAYLTFEKCVVANCYISSDATSQSGVLMGAGAPFINVAMKNCLVYSNRAIGNATATNAADIVEEGICGNLSTSHNAQRWNGHNTDFSNSIILDCVPYSSVEKHGQAFKPAGYSNVYTNCITEYLPCGPNGGASSIDAWYTDGKITLIDKADVKGDSDIIDTLNADNDSTVWFADPNGGYPTFESDVLAIAGKTDFWSADSSIATEYRADGDNYGYTDGNMQLLNPNAENSESNPYIVETAEQLCYLIRGGQVVDSTQSPAKTDTNGKYYKVADGISTFYLNTLNGAYIDDSTSIDDIYDYMFGDGTNGQGNNFGSKNYFQGHFDGNGVTIYGLAQGVTKHGGGANAAGLFPYVSGNASIKNVAVSKAFLCTKDQAGGIVAKYTGKTTTTVDGTTTDELTTLVIENCSVTDSYIESIGTNQAHTIGAIIGYADGWISGVGNASVKINNCFVNLEEKYFNTVSETVTHDASVTTGYLHGGVLGYGGTNQVRISNSVVLGIKPYNTWKNKPSSAIGQHGAGSDRFINVYTDQPTGKITCGIYTSGGTESTYTQDYTKVIFNISPSQIAGTAAVDTLSGFDFDNVWSYDGNGGYPTPISDAIPTTSQFNLNLLGANIAYNNNGSFNFNFYYEAADSDIVPVLYVGRADGDGFTKLAGTPLDAGEAAALGVAEGTLRYSIKNISAREIGDTFLPTAVAVNGPSTVWGKSEQISVADYAAAVINDATVDSADKQVAAALVNYGTAAAEALAITTSDTTVATKIVYANDGISQTAPEKGTGTEADPIIIENASHLRYLAQKSTPDTTYGKYYKVDPSIAVLVFQRENYIKGVAGSLEAFLALDAEGVKDALSTASVTVDGKNYERIQYQSGSSGSSASGYDGFAGNIDFSGVTICGMYNTNGGLFSYVNGGATFKNLTVCNNYIASGWFSGNVVGYIHNGSATQDEFRAVTLSNIVVHDCYQTTIDNGWVSTGVLVGNANASNKIPIHVSNILTYDNISLGQKSKDDTTMMDCALYGLLPTSWDGDNSGVPNASFSNIVTLDCVPYPIASINNQTTKPAYWSNVYTAVVDAEDREPCSWYQDGDQWNLFDITKLSSADLALGAAAKTNMPGLDWTNSWIVNDGDYPTPVQSGVTSANGRTIYWDGTVAKGFASGTGEASDPYIISTAAELAYVVGLGTATDGKYYKVADGIDKIVLQDSEYAQQIINLETTEDVQTYFEDSSKISPRQWIYTGWASNAFCGHFDGNGATVYGMYSAYTTTGNSNPALFPAADEGAEFKNLAIKNSYVYGRDGWDAAIFVAIVCSGTYGTGQSGRVYFENCTLTNNYAKIPNTRGGVLIGSCQGDSYSVNNCFIYGNDIKWKDGTVAPLAYGLKNDLKDADDKFVYVSIANSIVFDNMPYLPSLAYRTSEPQCYSNVYTDAPAGNVYNKTSSNEIFTDSQLKQITKESIIGNKAIETLSDTWDWNTAENPTGVWYVGNQYNYPSFKPVANGLPAVYQAAYDALTFDVYDNYDIYDTDNIKFAVYTTSVNLKNNPYLGITFAFNGEYKENRDKIEITLAKEDGTVLKTADQMKIPAYVEGEYISGVNGWTNKKNAGKYHLYTLNDLAIYDLCEPIVITMTYGDTTVKAQVSLSGFGNDMQSAYLKTGDDYYANCAEAVKALLYYTQSLKACYDK